MIDTGEYKENKIQLPNLPGDFYMDCRIDIPTPFIQ